MLFWMACKVSDHLGTCARSTGARRAVRRSYVAARADGGGRGGIFQGAIRGWNGAGLFVWVPVEVQATVWSPMRLLQHHGGPPYPFDSPLAAARKRATGTAKWRLRLGEG